MNSEADGPKGPASTEAEATPEGVAAGAAGDRQPAEAETGAATERAKRLRDHAEASVGWPPPAIAPDWIRWRNADSVLLDDAVAISLGCESMWDQLIVRPGTAPVFAQFEVDFEQPGAPRAVGIPAAMKERTRRRVTRRAWDRKGELVRWHHPAHTTAEGRLRLGLLRDYFGSEYLPAAHRADGKKALRLDSLADFARMQGWAVPAQLAELEPAAPQRKPPAALPPAARVVTRRELQREVVAAWPTVRSDLSKASTNGLAASAKARERGWRIDDAIAWAKETTPRRWVEPAERMPASVFSIPRSR